MRKQLHAFEDGPPVGSKFIKLKMGKVIGTFLSLIILLGLTSQLTLAQSAGVTGSVSDENGQTLPGVSVTVKGTQIGTQTDNHGRYTIKAPANSVLVFSFIGYLKKEVEVKGKTTVSLTLSPDIRNLNDVVVIGYGTQKKGDITGSVSSVSPNDYKNQPVNRLDQVLQRPEAMLPFEFEGPTRFWGITTPCM